MILCNFPFSFRKYHRIVVNCALNFIGLDFSFIKRTEFFSFKTFSIFFFLTFRNYFLLKNIQNVYKFVCLIKIWNNVTETERFHCVCVIVERIRQTNGHSIFVRWSCWSISLRHYLCRYLRGVSKRQITIHEHFQ